MRKNKFLQHVVSLFTILLVVILFQGSTYAQAKRQITVADPTIFYYKNTYYLYGTADTEQQKGFRVYTSSDKKNWKDAGVALKSGDVYGSTGFWAPQVFRYRNKFYMAYVANEQIAIAESDSPLGPFIQKVKKAIDGPTKMIDPFVFFDSGKVYLYHVRLNDGNRIYVTEMEADLSAIREESTSACIAADMPWENTAAARWGVTEGPSVFRRDGLYYLFYSANDFRNPNYAVGYATSSSAKGPWKKYSGNPILSKFETGENGTGHGDFFKDSRGKLNYVFHVHESNTKNNGKRRTAMVEMDFKPNGSKDQSLMVYRDSFYFLTY